MTAVKHWLLISALVAASGAARGQEPSDSGRVAPIAPIGAPAATPETSPPAATDTGPAPALASITQPIIGSLFSGRNMFTPRVRVYQTMDTNPGFQPKTTEWQSVSYVSGGLSMRHTSRNRLLYLEYNGGGNFYAKDSQANSSFHQLGATLSSEGARTSFTFAEWAMYLPATGAFGGAPVLSSDGSVLRPELTPSQSFFASNATFSSTTASQLGFRLGPRSSITFGLGYALQRFFGGTTLTDQDTGTLSISFDRRITPRSSLGIDYTGSVIRLPASAGLTDTHTFMLGYTRKVSGRMVLELAGGPQLSNPRDVFSAGRVLGGAGRVNLAYELRRTTLGVGYSHGIFSGNGVFGVSVNDEVSLQVSRRFSRTVSLNWQANYWRSLNLGQSNAYESWIAGLSLNRTLSRTVGMFMDYRVSKQSAIGAVPFDLRQTAGIGFSWQGTPFVRH